MFRRRESSKKRRAEGSRPSWRRRRAARPNRKRTRAPATSRARRARNSEARASARESRRRAPRLLHVRTVHVPEREHCGEPRFPLGPEATRALELGRISIGSEQHVPDRQIAEVTVMYAERVVTAVHLRPLHEEAQPAWSPHVEVVKILCHRGVEGHPHGPRRLEPE